MIVGGVRVAVLPLVLVSGAAVGGCSAEPDAPSAVSADEDRQLNEAAAMLDANSVDANALDDNGADQ